MKMSGRYLMLVGVFLSGLLLLPTAVIAADKVLDVGEMDRNATSLARYFAVLEDPGRTLTLADVQEPGTASRFTSVQAETAALSYGFTRSAFWLRLNLRNRSDRPVERMLELGYPLLSSIQFHRPNVDGTHQSLATGVAMPFASRAYPGRSFVFPLTLPPHSQQTVYLRVHSVSAMLVPALLWEPQAFRAHERNDYAAQAWYFGMATALILLHFLLFVALRDVAYLLYSGFATLTALTISASNGWGKEFLWPELTLWSDLAVSALGSLTLAALLVFMRRLLNTRKTYPAG